MHDLLVVATVVGVALVLAAFGLYVVGIWATYRRLRLDFHDGAPGYHSMSPERAPMSDPQELDS